MRRQEVGYSAGDVSRGEVGIWIETGKLAYPVEEIAIIGNREEMFQDIERIDNDLHCRSSIAASTLEFARITVAGN